MVAGAAGEIGHANVFHSMFPPLFLSEKISAPVALIRFGAGGELSAFVSATRLAPS